MSTSIPLELSTADERASLIRPIEKLLLPHAIDGSAAWANPWDGRKPVEFSNDIDAIRAWVDSHRGADMRQACRGALEKILLWCVVERGHALAEFNGEEVALFIQFLRAPAPRTRWITDSVGHRTSTDWKPLKVPMQPPRIGAALQLINAYFRWANARGLLLTGTLLHALSQPLKEHRSAMATANRPLTLPRVSTPVWLALHPFLQGDRESYKDLQVLGLHQLLYYGAVSQRQIFKLQLRDFVAHQRCGSIAAWEFPSGIGQATIFSCGPLTETLTLLLGLTPVPNGASRREQFIFNGCSLRAPKAFKNAKKKACAGFQLTGELERSAALSKLKLVHLRGGLLEDGQLQSANLDLASVFSATYLNKFPNTNKYGSAQLEVTEKRLKCAAKLSDWIHENERAHLDRSKLPPAV